MQTWFTSDTHFGHERIIELCDRPFDSVDEMNDALVDNWNSVVREYDEVYHLGDFIMGRTAINIEIVKRLNGSIYLVPGNHDTFKRIDMLEDFGVTIMNEVENISLWGFDFVMSHYPYYGDFQSKDRFRDRRPLDDGLPLIHGHVHEKWQICDKMINVGVDVNGFAPVSADQVVDMVPL